MSVIQKLFDAQNNLRWITSHSTPGSSVNGSVTAEISDLRSNVSAIFEDGEAYYIASSGFPSHDIIKAGVSIPNDIQDQRLLKIVRKNPISTTEIYTNVRQNRLKGLIDNIHPLNNILKS